MSYGYNGVRYIEVFSEHNGMSSESRAGTLKYDAIALHVRYTEVGFNKSQFLRLKWNYLNQVECCRMAILVSVIYRYFRNTAECHLSPVQEHLNTTRLHYMSAIKR